MTNTPEIPDASDQTAEQPSWATVPDLPMTDAVYAVEPAASNAGEPVVPNADKPRWSGAKIAAVAAAALVVSTAGGAAAAAALSRDSGVSTVANQTQQQTDQGASSGGQGQAGGQPDEAGPNGQFGPDGQTDQGFGPGQEPPGMGGGRHGRGQMPPGGMGQMDPNGAPSDPNGGTASDPNGGTRTIPNGGTQTTPTTPTTPKKGNTLPAPVT